MKKKKSKKLFTVRYQFDGKGSVDIKARSASEAEDIFMSGDYDRNKEIDDSDNHSVYAVDEN